VGNVEKEPRRAGMVVPDNRLSMGSFAEYPVSRGDIAVFGQYNTHKRTGYQVSMLIASEMETRLLNAFLRREQIFVLIQESVFDNLVQKRCPKFDLSGLQFSYRHQNVFLQAH
jgi:hypothetical protein